MKREDVMNGLAASLDEVLTEMYGLRVGFVLLAFPFQGKGMGAGTWGDCVSNTKREDVIGCLRNIADQLEKGIGRTIESA